MLRKGNNMKKEIIRRIDRLALMLKGSVLKSINTHGRLSFNHPRKRYGSGISGSTLVLGICTKFSEEKLWKREEEISEGSNFQKESMSLNGESLGYPRVTVEQIMDICKS
jgi:hypothetical protein